LSAKPEMRGRVMSLWALAWFGSTPIGGPIVGWIGQDAGARWSLIVGGLATLLCGVAVLALLRSSGDARSVPHGASITERPSRSVSNGMSIRTPG
jgi:MFS family permease